MKIFSRRRTSPSSSGTPSVPGPNSNNNLFDNIKGFFGKREFVMLIVLVVLVVIFMVASIAKSNHAPDVQPQPAVTESGNGSGNSEAQDEDNQGEDADANLEAKPNGTVIYGGVTYDTYDTIDEAKAHLVGLPSNLASDFQIEAIPQEGTARMKVWTDWSSSGILTRQELFLSDQGGWKENLNLIPYAGQDIVLCICAETGDLFPVASYQFVGFSVPDTVSSPKVIPNATVVCGGMTYVTYDTEDEAKAHLVGLPSNLASDFQIEAIPQEGTSRINVWVDWNSGEKKNSQEIFLSSDGDWKNTLNLVPYAGQDIILCIRAETSGFPPEASYKFVGFSVPSTVTDQTPAPDGA